MSDKSWAGQQTREYQLAEFIAPKSADEVRVCPRCRREHVVTLKQRKNGGSKRELRILCDGHFGARHRPEVCR